MRTIDSSLRDSTSIDRSLPANLTADDAGLFEDQCTYSTYKTCLKDVGKSLVSADSVVYKNYTLVRDTLYRADDPGYYRLRYLAKKLINRRVQLERGKNYLIATDQESNGHFHWFTEVLPRLWLVRDNSSNFVLMLPDLPYMRSVGISSLERSGLHFEDILWMKRDEFYSVPDLYLITKVSRTGQMHDEIMRELNKALISDVPAGKGRYYIPRDRAGFRKVLNEAELIERLAAHKFEVIRPEEMSFIEQVNAFAECGTLIGLHGAGLTNCLFMPPGGKVVELRKREPNHGYWHLADSVGHKYYYYHGVPDSDLSLIGRGCNLTIQLDDFEEKILGAL